MKSQYPSGKPAMFPNTAEGYVSMKRHDHGWAVGSGYIEPDSVFDEDAAVEEGERLFPKPGGVVPPGSPVGTNSGVSRGRNNDPGFVLV
jgi:hypothetical protein